MYALPSHSPAQSFPGYVPPSLSCPPVSRLDWHDGSFRLLGSELLQQQKSTILILFNFFSRTLIQCPRIWRPSHPAPRNTIANERIINGITFIGWNVKYTSLLLSWSCIQRIRRLARWMAVWLRKLSILEVKLECAKCTYLMSVEHITSYSLN